MQCDAGGRQGEGPGGSCCEPCPAGGEGGVEQNIKGKTRYFEGMNEEAGLHVLQVAV